MGGCCVGAMKRGRRDGDGCLAQSWLVVEAGRLCRRVRGSPVCLQKLGQVLACILQLVLVQTHIKHVLKDKVTAKVNHLQSNPYHSDRS